MILVLTAGGTCCCAWLSKMKYEEYEDVGDEGKAPKWYSFVFANVINCVVLGIVVGRHNFGDHMMKVYMYSELATYTDIQPADYAGAQLPDAGIVTFSRDTYLRVNYSMGFTNHDTYCVAPIVSPHIHHYDDFNF